MTHHQKYPRRAAESLLASPQIPNNHLRYALPCAIFRALIDCGVDLKDGHGPIRERFGILYAMMFLSHYTRPNRDLQSMVKQAVNMNTDGNEYEMVFGSLLYSVFATDYNLSTILRSEGVQPSLENPFHRDRLKQFLVFVAGLASEVVECRHNPYYGDKGELYFLENYTLNRHKKDPLYSNSNLGIVAIVTPPTLRGHNAHA